MRTENGQPPQAEPAATGNAAERTTDAEVAETEAAAVPPAEDPATSAEEAPKSARAPGKSANRKPASKSASSKPATVKKARRTQRPFPAVSFEDAIVLAEEIQRLAGGQTRIRRLTLFEQLDRSPDSGLARQQVVNSNRYGLTEGSYKADFLELTKLGAVATNSEAPARERTRARFQLAIMNIAPFASLYESLKGNKLPAQQVMRDHLVEDQKLDAELAKEAVELFIVNAKHVGVLRPISGNERVLTIEHVLDELPATAQRGGTGDRTLLAPSQPPRGQVASDQDLGKVCFYVTPIGDDGSEERKHADVFLGHLVEPAVEALDAGMGVVRADHIENPGLITAQVIQHILHARLVIADLSFHNPNVFYELALRHATGKPTVLICRQQDKLPFDISDIRTIRVDMTDIHSFVTQMETWRAELTNMARRALDDPETSANPLTAFAGDFQALTAR
jgi:hypothetical protein